MSDKAKIKLLRTSQTINSGRTYEIYLDGQKRAEVVDGEEKILSVSAGQHQIYLKIDWCKSK